MRHISSLTSILFCTVLMIGCDQDGDKAVLKGIRDTVDLSVSFTIDRTNYNFHLSPGDTPYLAKTNSTEVDQVYITSGFTSYASFQSLIDAGSYVEMTDTKQNIRVLIGMGYSPIKNIDPAYDDICKALTLETDKYLVTGDQSLCDSWSGAEFVECSSKTKGKFYFQLQFEDLNNKRKFKSGINENPGGSFTLTKIETLPFLGEKTNEGDFHLLLEGAFSVTLEEFRFGESIKDPEKKKLDNGKFQLGFRRLCMR